LTKIFDLSQVGSSKNSSGIADDNDNNVQGYLMFGFLAFIYIFTIYGLIKWGDLPLHTPASAHGGEVDSLMNITWVVIFFVQAVTQALLYYFGFKYRGRKDQTALYFSDNNKLEVIWSVIPAIVLTILVIRGLKTWNNMMNHRDPKAIVVEVFGYQFGWNARYAGADNKLGNHDFRQIGVVNALGVDPKDPKSQDDIITNELHFPVGKAVSLKFRAKDVIHSAYLPHFRVQMNVVPGLPTQFNFTPSITTAEMRNKLNNPKFDYILLCNKICGGAHYRMKMKVIVDSPEEYAKWLSSQPNLASTSTPPTAVDSTGDANSQALLNRNASAKTIASK
jgi:cytochrome c oxidase subunit 2